jgi:hypothetical protein
MQRHSAASETEAAKIAAELERWSSPRIGTTLSSLYRYERDPAAWLLSQQPDKTAELSNATTMEEDDDDSKKQSTQATPERVGTPVMSNLTTPSGNDDDDRPVPFNVQSPWLSNAQPSGTPAAVRATTARATTRTTALVPLSKANNSDFRRYYESFVTYLRGKRSMRERMARQREHPALLALGNTDDPMDTVVDKKNPPSTLLLATATTTSKLVKGDTIVELDYLRSLNSLCWNSDHRREGNFWSLVCSLREHGLASLLWDDDAASAAQHESSVQAYIQDLARAVELTPKELMDALYNDNDRLTQGGHRRPCILQRRRLLLQWLHRCLANGLPGGVRRARNATVVWNQALFGQGLPETDKDIEVFQCVLALLTAGRLPDALQLARDSNMPWRAAVWGGGAPQGYNDRHEEIGNPRRFLWKRAMWLQAEKLKKDPAASDDETAIAALLSSHLKIALSTVALRTWEHGLFAVLRAMMDRSEDELLQRHNANRRKMQPPFPGAEHERMEVKVLEATSDISGFNETDAVNTLASTPYDAMKGDDIVTRATASFLVGKSAILLFFNNAMRYMHVKRDKDASSLRFLTHIALYLDSLSSGATPVVVYNIEYWKNELVSRYVELLASSEDLWYMMVPYASHLPETFLLETLPRYLSVLESTKERQSVVDQLCEFVPALALPILKNVVQVLLHQNDPATTATTTTTTTTTLDVRKMRAVLWLGVVDAHAGEALVASNQMLRQFVRTGKYQAAIAFLQGFVLPHGMVELVSLSMMEENNTSSSLERTQSEFVAWQVFLEALEAYDKWDKVVADEPAVFAPTTTTNKQQQLNPTETAIALDMDRRLFVQAKREVMGRVVSAADHAQTALMSVLTHPGGWLWFDEKDSNADFDSTTQVNSQVGELRTQQLPEVVRMYQSVCLLTSQWLSRALDDAAVRLDEDRRTALERLDEVHHDNDARGSSPMSPVYWAQHAWDVVDLVASDEYKIGCAFGTVELKALMENTSETVVALLLGFSNQ